MLALHWLHTKTRYMNLSKLTLSISMSALFLCQTPSKPPNLGDAITEQVSSLSYSLKNAYISVSKAFKEGPMTLFLRSKSQISILKNQNISSNVCLLSPSAVETYERSKASCGVFDVSFLSMLKYHIQKPCFNCDVSSLALEGRHR